MRRDKVALAVYAIAIIALGFYIAGAITGSVFFTFVGLGLTFIELIVVFVVSIWRNQ